MRPCPRHANESNGISSPQKRSKLISPYVSIMSSYPACNFESRHHSLSQPLKHSSHSSLITSGQDYRFKFRFKSTTLLLALSRLPRTPLLELLELPLLFLLASSGSVGCSPLALANRFSISVKLMTPLSLPDMCCPGIADAETDGVALRGWNGGLACGKDVERCWVWGTGGWATGGWAMETGVE